MQVSKLSEYFSKLEATTSRNEMTALLADLLKESSRDEIDKICYFSLGRLAPLYAGIEFNLAEKMMVKVLSLAYGADEIKVRRLYKKKGDLGEVAEDLTQSRAEKGTRKHAELSVEEVYGELRRVAEISGVGSQEKKVRWMAELLQKLDPLSVRYIVRIPLGKLRLGFSDLTILDALSWMIAGDKSKKVEIEEAFHARADIGQIAQIIKKKGLKGLKRIGIDLGVPIMPALCQRLPTAEKMIEKMGRVAVEPKYDGTRLQVHFSRKRRWEEPSFAKATEGEKGERLLLGIGPTGFVRTFTRNLENTTRMFPDLVEAVFEEVGAQEAILDCEAIGFDPKTGRFLPFQETIKRKRKYGIGKKAKEIPLKFFCFDILSKDGKDLLKIPFIKRREILEKALSSKNKTILPSPQIVTNDPQELRRYHDEQIKKGLEGVVVKKWEAPYDPGRRGYTWVKFKQEKGKKGGGLADTLDCIVMGYYHGRGKRAEFGIGAFLVGVGKEERILTISKIGTGLSDGQWREMYRRCEKVKTKEKPRPYQVAKDLTPDVWCHPKIVVEIEADNITKSPIHTAKYALRFPRLVQFRDDRSPQDATTLREVETLFKQQKGR